MEEKRVRYWFRGNKEHGRELIGRLVNEFGANNAYDLDGSDAQAVYFRDIDGTIKVSYADFSKEIFEGWGVKKNPINAASPNETIPAEVIKPTSTVITAPFYRVQDCECVRAEYYPTYEDAKAVAEKISEEQNTKTYILAPIAKLVPTVTVAMAAFNNSDIPKGC